MTTLEVEYFAGTDVSQDITGGLADGLASVMMRVNHRLAFFRGTWFLDLLSGIPHVPDVFGHQTTLQLAQRTITEAIRTVPDVTDVTEDRLTVNNEQRHLSYYAVIHTIFGNQTVTVPNFGG